MSTHGPIATDRLIEKHSAAAIEAIAKVVLAVTGAAMSAPASSECRRIFLEQFALIREAKRIGDRDTQTADRIIRSIIPSLSTSSKQRDIIEIVRLAFLNYAIAVWDLTNSADAKSELSRRD